MKRRKKYDVKTRRFVDQPREAFGTVGLEIYIDEYNLTLLKRGVPFNSSSAHFGFKDTDTFYGHIINNFIGQMYHVNDNSFNLLINFQDGDLSELEGIKNKLESEGNFHSLFLGPFSELVEIGSVGGRMRFKFIPFDDLALAD